MVLMLLEELRVSLQMEPLPCIQTCFSSEVLSTDLFSSNIFLAFYALQLTIVNTDIFLAPDKHLGTKDSLSDVWQM